MKTIDIDAIDVTKLTRCYTMDGHCGGVHYGEVYELGAGCGWLAGVRSKANFGLGLMQRKQFGRLSAAKDYAVAHSDN